MSQKSDQKPDILIILSDQHSASITGCYGDPVVKTPNIDRLAAEGALFEQAYCPLPVCAPSRMSLMTGRYPHDIECWDNAAALASDIPTFAHALGIAGYEVVINGRAHWNGPDQRHGFKDRLVGDVSQSYWGGGANEWWVRVKDTTYLTGMEGFYRPAITTFSGPGWSQFLDYDTAVLGAALNFIAERSRQSDRDPFCLVVGFSSPHYWFACPQEDYDLYDGKIDAPLLPDDHPESLHPSNREMVIAAGLESIPLEDVIRTRTAYYGLVTFTDRMIGQLVDALEHNGLKDNTLTLYSTDHGEMAGEHGMWWKHNFYEGASHIPLIVSFPGRLPQGKRVAEPVSLVDVLPSLCDWTGAPPPPKLAGRSLDSLIKGEKWPDERAVFSELYRRFPGESAVVARMVRQGVWKYNYYHGQPSEMFNLEEDPREFHNVAEAPAYRDIRGKLEKLVLEGWDPEEILPKLREFKQGVDYLEQWTRAVNPPDPDQWEGMKPPFPEEWRQNALSLPEYTNWLRKRES